MRTRSTSTIPTTRTPSRCRGDGSVPVVSLRTFSKLYGLAGLRVGYAVAPPAVIDALGRIRQPFNVNSLAQVAALAALDDQEHVERTLAVNREGMAYLREQSATGWGCRRARAAPTSSWCAWGGERVYEALLRRGVIVRPMDGLRLPRAPARHGRPAGENARFIAALDGGLGDGRRVTPLVDRMSDRGRRADRRLARRWPRGRPGWSAKCVGFGRTAANLAVARERGAHRPGRDRPTRAASDVDLIVLAAPVGTVRRRSRRALRRMRARARVLTDVGSVKATLVADARAALERCGPRRRRASDRRQRGVGRGRGAAPTSFADRALRAHADAATDAASLRSCARSGKASARASRR